MKLNDLSKLKQKKYRQSFGYYLVEGEHLILELQKAAKNQPQLSSTVIYVTEKYAHWESVFEVVEVSEARMIQFSDTKTPQGIIARVPLPSRSNPQAVPDHSLKAIYLYEPQDPGNLGTILRSLAWFGGFKLIMSPNSADPYNPKVVRASMGAIFHVPMEFDVSVEALADRFDRMAYLDIKGTNIRSSTFSDHQCFIFGNEARGVPHTLLAQLEASPYSILGCGAIESMNLASAVNICAFQVSH
ncbi:TrmH family RNA methyltransferase [Umboniibacter marinipuniceus]|uniref:TrmH family RNA methyltransferase n=1 Tax=Umboniibacter marinipuniceus TaxID=569599 RepID=A0A3M0A4C1_9GAMM|nr:RNA methyltransferase [Umboniibacter marinipuniceus]RMA77608.1 TrmH family RNA methyltransferase [Umboniibacter marinipuniceus]